MAAQISILVSSLVRIATNAGNPVAYLTDILTGHITRVVDGSGRVVVSTSSGGTSATWTLPQGMNDLEMTQLAELALRTVETNVNSQVVYGPNGPENLPPIVQLNNADRTTSYGQFGNVQH